MADVVTMPKLGETVTEGTVNAWLKGKVPSRGIPGQPILAP